MQLEFSCSQAFCLPLVQQNSPPSPKLAAKAPSERKRFERSARQAYAKKQAAAALVGELATRNVDHLSRSSNGRRVRVLESTQLKKTARKASSEVEREGEGEKKSRLPARLCCLRGATARRASRVSQEIWITNLNRQRANMCRLCGASCGQAQPGG